MILFLIFALVVVIATGIPFVKKIIENRKILREYVEEQGLGKNEAIGKIKDAKTTNEKVIEGLFYVSLIALFGGGFYNLYLLENNNSDNMCVQQQSTRTMAQITTDQDQNEDYQNQQDQEKKMPFIQNNIISGQSDAKVQENVKREQARIDRLFTENTKNTESLLDVLKKSLEKKDASEGIRNGERGLENVKKSNNLLKNTKCITTGDANFDKECPKQLEKRKEQHSKEQINAEKRVKQIIGMFKDVEKGIKDFPSSEVGQQVVQEGNKLWDNIMKKIDEYQQSKSK